MGFAVVIRQDWNIQLCTVATVPGMTLIDWR
jgi:hypothetical protein